MGQFQEPEAVSSEPIPKIFTQKFFESVINKSIENGEVGKDDRLVFIAACDEKGVKAIVAATVIDREIVKLKLSGIFEHDWEGDTKAGAKVIFSIK